MHSPGEYAPTSSNLLCVGRTFRKRKTSSKKEVKFLKRQVCLYSNPIERTQRWTTTLRYRNAAMTLVIDVFDAWNEVHRQITILHQTTDDYAVVTGQYINIGVSDTPQRNDVGPVSKVDMQDQHTGWRVQRTLTGKSNVILTQWHGWKDAISIRTNEESQMGRCNPRIHRGTHPSPGHGRVRGVLTNGCG